METERQAIVDGEWDNKIVSVVESVDIPWVFGVVIVAPDWGNL